MEARKFPNGNPSPLHVRRPALKLSYRIQVPRIGQAGLIIVLIPCYRKWLAASMFLFTHYLPARGPATVRLLLTVAFTAALAFTSIACGAEPGSHSHAIAADLRACGHKAESHCYRHGHQTSQYSRSDSDEHTRGNCHTITVAYPACGGAAGLAAGGRGAARNPSRMVVLQRVPVGRTGKRIQLPLRDLSVSDAGRGDAAPVARDPGKSRRGDARLGGAGNACVAGPERSKCCCRR